MLRSLTRGAALGGLASLAAGCSAARAYLHTDCITTPEPSGDRGPIIEGLIPATHIRTPIHYALVVPRGLDPRTVTRIVYALPGRGGNAHDLVTSTGYAAYAQTIMRNGGAPFAVLAMDAGESYVHPRSSGEDRLGVLMNDLPVLARSLLSPQIDYEALVGVSMGGYGALLAAERNPQRYRAVAVAGPALFQSYGEENRAIGDGFDDAAQFATYDVIAHAAKLAHTPVLVRAGYGDPFYANVKAFAKACPHADVGYIEHGCHDDGVWRLTAPQLLSFVTTKGRA
jgi:pimeloyl-ACP methyl ester carboxylesterase